MRFDPATAAQVRRWSPLALEVVLGFWALHIVYRVANAFAMGNPDELSDVALHVSIIFGIALSFVLCALLAWASRRSLALGLAAAAMASVPAAGIFAGAELGFHFALSPKLQNQPSVRTMPDGTVVTVMPSGLIVYRKEGRPTQTLRLSPPRQRLADRALATAFVNATGWYFFFFGLGSFFVGMRNAARLRLAERRAAELERLAQVAHLEALRYQINPHFLFNTLNSLSSLVMAGRAAQAEAMLLNLSRFYRSTLTIKPADDIALAAELDLQRLYLDIEAVRFPRRLAVRVAVPDELLDARLPALLLQPLIENAIKHGVARSRGTVTIAIGGRRDGDRDLALTVENDLAAPTATDTGDGSGTGTGLRNVEERLEARFGAQASVVAGVGDDGRYRVVLRFPLVR